MSFTQLMDSSVITISISPLWVNASHKEKLKYAVESSPSVAFPKAKTSHHLRRIEERTLVLAKSCPIASAMPW
jgi:hypothetical protein